MNTSAPTIPAETANHVLFHFGRGGYQAGTFTQILIAALCAADMTNKAKLADAYPDYAAAVIAMEYDPDGAANLQRIAGGLICSRCHKDDGPFDDGLCEACAAPQPFSGGVA
jgi:hypothetical protein